MSKDKGKTPVKRKRIVFDDNYSSKDAENDNPSPDYEVKRRSSRLASKSRKKKTSVIKNIDSKEDPIGDKEGEDPNTTTRAPDGDVVDVDMTRDPMVPTTVGAVDMGNSKMQTQDPIDVKDTTPMNMGTEGVMGKEIYDNKALDSGNLDSDLKMVEQVMQSLPLMDLGNDIHNSPTGDVPKEIEKITNDMAVVNPQGIPTL